MAYTFKEVRKGTGFAELSERVLAERSLARLVSGAILQGEVSKGEVLKAYVHELATIQNYTPGTGVNLTGDNSDYVTINNLKDKAVNEVLDGLTVEMAYNQPDYVAARLEAAVEALAEEQDKDLFAKVATDGKAATSVAFTALNAKEEILKLKLALDKAKAPNENRFLVVTPEVENAILAATDIILHTPTGDTILYDGYLGNIFGFKVVRSNNLPAKVQMIGIQTRGIAHADGWKVPVTLFDLNDSKHVGDSKIAGRMAYNSGIVRQDLVQVSKTA